MAPGQIWLNIGAWHGNGSPYLRHCAFWWTCCHRGASKIGKTLFLRPLEGFRYFISAKRNAGGVSTLVASLPTVLALFAYLLLQLRGASGRRLL